MLMKSEDLKKQAIKNLGDAVRDGDTEKFEKAFVEYADAIQTAVMNEAKGIINANDMAVLSRRGVNALTSEEVEYYNSVAEMVKSGRPMNAIAGEEVEKVMPKTTVDRIFDDLQQQHPLLAAINFQNVSGLVEIYLNNDPGTLATWCELTGTISTEITSGFTKLDLTHNKLSAFLPIAQSMVDLGPSYLDQYIRTVLSEAIALGLEKAAVQGSGKNEPIGMMKQVAEGVSVSGGVYPDKTAIKVTDFDAATLGKIVAKIAKTEKGKSRTVTDLALIVNDGDYWEKVMPATTIMAPDGTYRNNVLPIPAQIIPSSQVPAGKAVLGMPAKYFFGLGTGTGMGGKLEYSDQYQFLEDNRVYKIKLYGTGRACGDTDFQVLDISKLNPLAYSVKNLTTTTTAVGA